VSDSEGDLETKSVPLKFNQIGVDLIKIKMEKAGTVCGTSC